ncbi:MAG: ComEC family competence protein [Anaerolineaceae bacterium]|nr:ComEC family competence protein [Anaerolineaceae bacterium]
MFFFWIILAFAAGIVLASLLALSPLLWGVGAILFALIAILSRKYSFLAFPPARRHWLLSAWVLLAALAAGGLRYALAQPTFTPQDLAWYNDRGEFQITAVVTKTSDHRSDATYLTLSARELYDPVSQQFHRISGTFLARTGVNAAWQLGDELQFIAKPLTPSENDGFSYRAYLARQDIYTIVYSPTAVKRVASGKAPWLAQGMEWLRQKARTAILSSFPQPESGLLEGILLGEDNDLPAAVKNAYQDTGTSHIIAISGFNMAVLAALFFAVFSRFCSRNWTTLITVSLLLLYTAFVGGSPSVARAAIMATAAFTGRLVGRKGGGYNPLALAAGVILLIEPRLLWDASFQLSFAATLGLLLFAGPLQQGLEKFLQRFTSEETSARLSDPLSEYFLFSIAAQITTLPIIALQFKQLSLTSLLANPLVLPVQSLILEGGAIATILGMLWAPLGKLAGAVIWPLLAYSDRVVLLLERIPNGVATLSGSAATWAGIGGIVVVTLATLRLKFKQFFEKLRFLWIAAGLVLVTVLVWSIALRQPDGELHVQIIRAGEETAVLLRSPRGFSLLLDPSGDVNSLAANLSQELSPWNFHLDGVLLTRRSAVSSAEALNERLPIRQAYLLPAVYQSNDDTSPVSLPEEISVTQLHENASLRLDEEITIQAVAADENGSALLITTGNTQILIPNGVDPALLPQVVPTVLLLQPADLENLPADMWQARGASLIVWESTRVPPEPDWVHFTGQAILDLATEGTRVKMH